MLLALDHVGVVVKDLSAAVGWYVQALEAQVIRYAAPTDVSPEGVALPEEPHVRLSGAVLKLRGGNAHVELLQYLDPLGQDATTRRSCDLGLGHIAFSTTDIHAEYARLAAHGVVWYGKPYEITAAGEFNGIWTVYGRDPHGVLIELFWYPTSRAPDGSQGANAAK